MISTNNAIVYFNLTTPQQHIRPQSQLPEQSYLMTPTFQSIHPTGIVSPPWCHLAGASFNATPVREMTVPQTANWIRTLGHYHGWTQVEAYAQSFLNNSITGVLLEDLTPDMLEFSLGIRNQRHQGELLSAIHDLHPNRRMTNTPHVKGNITGIEILESSYNNAMSSAHCQSETEYESECQSTNSYLISNNVDEMVPMECSDMMSESGYSQRSSVISYSESESDTKIAESTDTLSNVQSSDEKDIVMVDLGTSDEPQSVTPLKVRRPLRCRKLLLALRPREIEQDCCSLQSVRSRFQELEIPVEVELNETKLNTYTLVFPNYQLAEEVLSRADEIGYKITKKYPPRPCPKHPQKYKSMAELEIRSGKSLSGDIVGKLEEGVIVTVNQVKGRRARIIQESGTGDVETIGWVSLHEKDGVNLLKQLGDF